MEEEDLSSTDEIEPCITWNWQTHTLVDLIRIVSKPGEEFTGMGSIKCLTRVLRYIFDEWKDEHEGDTK